MIRQHLTTTEGLCGWHLGCGSGEDSFLISSTLNDPHYLLALDSDPALLQLARQSAQAKYHEALRFQELTATAWEHSEKQKLDFIYTRIWKA
nr:class I SAM-dependent methyltransferase [Saprospiraceae bacterium]